MGLFLALIFGISVMLVGYLVEIVVTIMLYAYWLLPLLIELIIYSDYIKLKKDVIKITKKYFIVNTIFSILHFLSVIYVHIKNGILFFVNINDGKLLFQKVQMLEERLNVILFVIPIISIIIFICMILELKKNEKKEENPNV